MRNKPTAQEIADEIFESYGDKHRIFYSDAWAIVKRAYKTNRAKRDAMWDEVVKLLQEGGFILES